MASRDATEEMVIERDLPIAVDDRLVLRADVYRPQSDVPVPVIMTSGPYGKGVMYQDHYKVMWDWLIAQHPGLLPGSTRSFLTWETVDPEIWVPWGYAVVRVDSRLQAHFSTHTAIGARNLDCASMSQVVLR
jgi:predicted acyl esterase